VDPSSAGLVALLVVSVGALLQSERSGDLRLRWLSKPVASAAFVALAWHGGVLAHPWGGAMLAGFVGCWWGDVLLIPADRRVFLAGIAAFALGHVGFAVAFVLRGVDPAVAGGTGLLLLPLAGVVLRWLWPHVSGVMRVAVPAYIVIICLMVAAAAGTAGLDAGGHGPAMLVGAVLFWLSDLCVARERFVTQGFVNRAIGLPLYYGAVLVLALASAA
jgi:uncharacterized membrane protein YhhN